MLRERSFTQKSIYCAIPFMGCLNTGKTYLWQRKKYNSVARDGGWQGGGDKLMGKGQEKNLGW